MSAGDHHIHYIDLSANSSESNIEEALGKDSYRKLEVQKWEKFHTNEVECSWKLLAGSDAFFIKFHVKEPVIRSVGKGDQSTVCEDSCVEWFVKPEGSENYINFEFNPLGAHWIAIGPNRNERTRFRDSELPGLRSWGSETEHKDNVPADGPWEFTAVIPYSIFQLEAMHVLGCTWEANFYKCGNHLPKEHYISWKEIGAPSPDFHRPEFFSPIIISKK